MCVNDRFKLQMIFFGDILINDSQNETFWYSQKSISELFNCSTDYVSYF